MDLVRTKHFQAYLEKVYVGMMARYKSLDENAAKAKFQDEFYDDINMMGYIINSTYPNTQRVGDIYHFITKDDFLHTDIKTKKEYKPGAMTLYIDENFLEHVSFENKNFHHGQINEQGHVTCWGGFKHHGFGEMFCGIGLSGCLMDMYNFARVSDHSTRWLNGVEA